MKKYILSILTILATGTMLLSSCSDAEDPQALNLARVKMPINLSAVADQMDPKITVSWTATSNADFYIVQAFEDDPTYSGTPAVEVETVESSCVLSNLVGEVEYYIRVKGIAEGIDDSNWSTISRKTAPEQILSVPFNSVEETSVELTWPTDRTIDRIDVLLNGSVKKTVPVSTTESAAGTYTITGLNGGENYTFEAYLGSKRRGHIDQKTEIGQPTTDYTEELSETTSTRTIQDVLDKYAAQAASDGKTSYSLTVKLAAGKSYDFYKLNDGKKDNFTIPEGMSVYFYGDKANKPTVTIACTQVNIDGNHDVIAFQKVKLEGAKYFVNQSKACNIGTFDFTLTDISGFKGNTFFRTQGSNKPNIKNIMVEKCIISDCGNNYSLFDMRKAIVGTVSIKNTTIYNSTSNGKNIVQADTELSTLSMTGVTVYNACGNAQAVYNLGNTGENVVIEDCIFAKSGDDGTQESKAGGTVNINNVYRTSDWTKPIGTLLDGVTATDIFADPESGDFTVKEDYVSLNAGDPRWLK